MIPAPPENANARITLSTPLAILGMLVDVVRQRFAEGVYSDPTLDWVWKPLDEYAPGDDDVIYVESGWNTNIEARTARPGIWIDIEQNVYLKAGIGHQDQMPVNIRNRLEQFYASGEAEIIIACTSTNSGESTLLGSIVQDHLQMASNIIQANFGLRDISDIVMNKTVKFVKDDKLWDTPIQFRVKYEARWATMPVENLLNALTVNLRDSDDPDLYYRGIALNVKYGDE